MSVTLISSDGQEFKVEQKVAEMNGTVKNAIADSGIEVPIPIPNLTAKALGMVLEFCEHNHMFYPLEDENKENPNAEWNDKFVEVKRENGTFDDDLLLELLMGANFMDNKPLMNLLCNRVRKCIEGKTPEEIRDEFNICQTCRISGKENDPEDDVLCEHGKKKIAFTQKQEDELRKIKPYEEWEKAQKELEKNTE
jgi:S-phase kinase-associated protein 1